MSYTTLQSTVMQQYTTAVYTAIPTSTTTSAQTLSTQSQTSLGTGWIIAIVALVALAISLTYIFWTWRSRRNAGRYRSIRSEFDNSRDYELERPKPARVRDSFQRFSRYR